jgi:hypothetical protein
MPGATPPATSNATSNKGVVNSLGLQEKDKADMKEKFNQYKSTVKDLGAGKLSVLSIE